MNKNNMNRNNMNRNNVFIILTVVFAVLFFVTFTGVYKFGYNLPHNYIFSKSMHNSMMGESGYGCCTQIACVFCLTDSEHKGVCDCFEEVVNGESPCAECVGNILQGNGNKYLAKSFAKAISEKMGDEYLLPLKDIIAQKYNVPVNEQY